MKSNILFKSLALAALLGASGHAAAVGVGCEYIQEGQSFCEADASGYSNPLPYDFHWYIFGYGPYSGFTFDTWSWQGVYCHATQLDQTVQVVVYDANGGLVGESSAQARCIHPGYPGPGWPSPPFLP